MTMTCFIKIRNPYQSSQGSKYMISMCRFRLVCLLNLRHHTPDSDIQTCMNTRIRTSYTHAHTFFRLARTHTHTHTLHVHTYMHTWVGQPNTGYSMKTYITYNFHKFLLFMRNIFQSSVYIALKYH